jgi:hypothetical protein
MAHGLLAHPDFMPWHREFIARFNSWRMEFGYPSISGTRNQPTGIEIDDTTRNVPSTPVSSHPGSLHARRRSSSGPRRIADFATLAGLFDAVEGTWQWKSGGIMCTCQSPAIRSSSLARHDRRLYENFCR